jgi:hypothetical protein
VLPLTGRRARFRHIGFRPREVPVPAAIDGVARLDVSLTSIPHLLEPVSVSAASACPRRSDESDAFALLEQARSALLASIVARQTNPAHLVRYAFERTHDGTDDKLTGMTVRIDSAAGAAASFSAVRAAGDFVKHGFMQDGPGGATFFAPDAEVVLDTAFTSNYCFRIVRDRQRPSQLGLGFTVARRQKDRIDVDGALWVDTTARAVTQIEFEYRGLDSRIEKFKPGGTLSFRDMPNGTVMIDRWTLRLIGSYIDTVTAVGHSGFGVGGGNGGFQERVNFFVQDRGGELAHARWPDGTTWDASLATLHATARRSNGRPARDVDVRLPGTPYAARTDAGGRLEIHDLVPGPYAAVVVDSVLKPIGLTIPTALHFTAERGVSVDSGFEARTASEYAVDRCYTDGMPRPRDVDTTYLLARFFDERGNPVGLVKWDLSAQESNADGAIRATNGWHSLRERAQTASDGVLSYCTSLRRTYPIEVRASKDNRNTTIRSRLGPALTVLPIPLNEVMTYAVNVTAPVAQAAPTTAVFTGVVVADSTHVPIAGAEVSFPELGKSVMSDAKGEFRFADVPPGEQHLQVRRLGYGAADTRLTFTAGETVVRRVVLGRAITLDPVNVNAQGVGIPSFDEHKHVGLGHFMDRAQIAKFDGMTMTSVLSEVQGVGMMGGRSSIFVTSRRAPLPSCPPGPHSVDCLHSQGFYVAEPIDRQYGVPAVACYSLVYLDGMLMNGASEPTEPFDLKSISPERIEAMEFYAGGAETPMEYSRMGSQCGVLVIWTRDFKSQRVKPNND